MYTVDDIYNRLNAGTAGTNPNTKNTFAEPTSGPASSSKDLNEVMSVAPAEDANGATAAEVSTGKTFWGLKSGSWGKQTGSGGTMASGDAVESDVLEDKTFSNVSGSSTGTMTNVGTQNIIPGTAETTITEGYHDGTGKVTGDSDLTQENIKSGVEIFGVTGTAALAPVAATGQTTSFDTGDLDDGQLQRGVTVTGDRFTDNGDGTVTDNLTELMWLKNANCADAVNWENAFTYITELNTSQTMNSNDCFNGVTNPADYNDWLLPNLRELQSLIDYQYKNHALSNTDGTVQWTEGDPFSSVVSSWYWSSTTYVFNTGAAWMVSLYYGSVFGTNKPGLGYVWPVRSGQ